MIHSSFFYYLIHFYHYICLTYCTLTYILVVPNFSYCYFIYLSLICLYILNYYFILLSPYYLIITGPILLLPEPWLNLDEPRPFACTVFVYYLYLRTIILSYKNTLLTLLFWNVATHFINKDIFYLLITIKLYNFIWFIILIFVYYLIILY